jgi:inorganic pyrophosphatase
LTTFKNNFVLVIVIVLVEFFLYIKIALNTGGIYIINLIDYQTIKIAKRKGEKRQQTSVWKGTIPHQKQRRLTIMERNNSIISAAILVACFSISTLFAGDHPKCHKNNESPFTAEYTADLLLAPYYEVIPGDYTAGVSDTLIFKKNRHLNLYLDFEAVNEDNTVNAVIEIPSGSDAKFETSVSTGRLFWELKNGAPRVVKYLGYPGNYGMVPRTIGGDGDPLDIVVIGGIMLRGTVAPVKVIGVFHLLDGGDVDDKLLAVIPGTAMGEINTLAELEVKYPGVKTIIETWLVSYKGPDGGLESAGFGDIDDASGILENAINAFNASH